MKEKIGIHPPSKVKQFFEDIGLIEITPQDLCSSQEQLQELYKTYPDLMGDSSSIGPGDDGNCQSWQGYKGWWKSLLVKERNE